MATKLLTARNLRVSRGIAQIAVSVIRESPLPYHTEGGGFPICDTPERAAEIFRTACPETEGWDWERESFVVLFLSTRRRVMGWQLVSHGTLDTLLVHPRDVFRCAIIANAAAVILAHNHPAGDPTPSETDIRFTRDIYRAGQMLKVEVLDHVIVASPSMRRPEDTRGWMSMKELGYFYN